MSKRRMLHFFLAIFMPALVVIGLYYGITGVVTLKEENRELKVENTKIQRDSIQLQSKVDSLKTNLQNQQKNTLILNDELNKTNTDLKNTKGLLDKSNIINKQLLDDNKKLKDELNKERAKSQTLSQIPSRGSVSGGKSFYVEATAYTALCNEGCTGITATGINLLKNPGMKVIAVDPAIVPLGSKVYVEGYGYAIAADTGGGINGYEVDLYVRSESIANQWGRRKVKLTILN